ncbi:MAG: chromosome segregation ATPase [Verrucomicrobiales bacterium]
MEDALSNVTRQKSLLEVRLVESGHQVGDIDSLHYQLSDARRGETDYRAETERLRLKLTGLRNSVAVADEALRVVTRQKSRFEGQLVSSRHETDTRIAELQKKLQDELAAAEQRVKEEQDALQEIQKSKAASDTHVADLEKQLAKLPTAEADSARLAKELETSLPQLQENKAASGTRVAELAKQLTKLPTIEADTAHLEKELATAKRLRTDR